MITEQRKWLLSRWKKLCIPVMITALVDITAEYVFLGTKTDCVTIAAYCLNLRGLTQLYWGFFSKYIHVLDNMGPLWFTTFIFFCYCLIPTLQKIKEKKLPWFWILAVLMLCLLILYYFTGINLTYFGVFFIAYAIGVNKKCVVINMPKYVIVTIGMLILQIGRIMLNKVSDGSNLYLCYITVSHFFLGLWMFVTVIALNRLIPKIMNKIANLRIVMYLDRNSIYIYIVHSIFCFGTLANCFVLFPNRLLGTVLFFAFVGLSAFVLKKLTEFLLSLFERKEAV